MRLGLTPRRISGGVRLCPAVTENAKNFRPHLPRLPNPRVQAQRNNADLSLMHYDLLAGRSRETRVLLSARRHNHVVTGGKACIKTSVFIGLDAAQDAALLVHDSQQRPNRLGMAAMTRPSHRAARAHHRASSYPGTGQASGPSCATRRAHRGRDHARRHDGGPLGPIHRRTVVVPLRTELMLWAASTALIR